VQKSARDPFVTPERRFASPFPVFAPWLVWATYDYNTVYVLVLPYPWSPPRTSTAREPGNPASERNPTIRRNVRLSQLFPEFRFRTGRQIRGDSLPILQQKWDPTHRPLKRVLRSPLCLCVSVVNERVRRSSERGLSQEAMLLSSEGRWYSPRRHRGTAEDGERGALDPGHAHSFRPRTFSRRSRKDGPSGTLASVTSTIVNEPSPSGTRQRTRSMLTIALR
jgi:hypothetical protein